MRSAVAVVSIALFLQATETVYAQTSPAAPKAGSSAQQQQAADEELILSVRANGVERGEFSLLRRADGDYWIPELDLPRLKLEPREQARRQVGKERYFSFAALGASAIDFNEAELTLSVNFAAKYIEGTQVDLSNRLPPAPRMTPQKSLILSYRLSARNAGQGQPTEMTLEDDLNVRVAGVLLRQVTRLDTAHNQRSFTRGISQAIWDNRDTATRFVAGDLVSSAGSYGSTITGAGLLLTKLYDMTPDVIKQPTVSVHASTSLPADVEVAVDGSPIFRTRVGPGPISLDNLLLYGGSRNVRITVTDAAGHREVIEQPFLFTDSVLAKGLHEYSYFIGKRSELGSDGAWRYREASWQGYHRYGLSDYLTVGTGGEGSTAFTNGGAGATLRNDLLGLFSLDILASIDRQASTRAQGWSARYTYVVPSGALVVGRRKFGDGFRTFSTTADSPFLKSEDRIGASTRLFSGSVSADFARSVDALQSRYTRSLRYSKNFGSRVTLSADYASTRTDGKPGWAANVFLRFDLGSQQWIGTTARATGSSHGIDVEAGKQLNQGEGLGYRLGLSSNSQGGQETASTSLSANWNLRPVTLEFLGSSQLRGGSSRYAEIGVSGSVVAVDGFWGLTRRVNDGFALARLGVPQAGVEISMNNQVQGATDKEGQLFIPQVGAFGRQEVSLNDKQVGMQYDIRERRRTIAPDYRSGTIVDFGARKVRAVAGMAWQIQNRQRLPIASRTWTLAGAGGKLTIETGSSGDFYLEDAPAGSYTGSLESGGRAYSCRLTVPDFVEVVHELKEGIICE